MPSAHMNFDVMAYQPKQIAITMRVKQLLEKEPYPTPIISKLHKMWNKTTNFASFYQNEKDGGLFVMLEAGHCEPR